MWKKVDSQEMFALLKPGDLISRNSANNKDQFWIEKIEGGYITAVYENEYLEIRIVHEKNLLSGNWWVKI